MSAWTPSSRVWERGSVAKRSGYEGHPDHRPLQGQAAGARARPLQTRGLGAQGYLAREPPVDLRASGQRDDAHDRQAQRCPHLCGIRSRGCGDRRRGCLDGAADRRLRAARSGVRILPPCRGGAQIRNPAGRPARDTVAGGDQVSERDRAVLHAEGDSHRDHQAVRVRGTRPAGGIVGSHRGPGLDRKHPARARPGGDGCHCGIHGPTHRQSCQPQVEVPPDERLDRGAAVGAAGRTLMRILATTDRTYKAAVKRIVSRSNLGGGKVEAAVKTILRAVERGGDAAVSRYTRRFDKVSLKPGQFRVNPDEIKEAYYKIRKEEGDSLRYAAHRITVFHEKEKPRAQTWMWQDGTITLGQTILPLDVIGLYVPGGKAVYPSSVLMSAIPAKVAGVKRIIMCVPAPKGVLSPYLLVAADIAGVDEVYRIRGVQAIAAMAYG